METGEADKRVGSARMAKHEGGRACIFLCNRCDAFLAARVFVHSPLVIEIGNRLPDLAARKLLHGLLQLGITLPHNLIELCCLHPRFFKLSKGPTRLN
jgi:hypothetical protein